MPCGGAHGRGQHRGAVLACHVFCGAVLACHVCCGAVLACRVFCGAVLACRVFCGAVVTCRVFHHTACDRWPRGRRRSGGREQCRACPTLRVGAGAVGTSHALRRAKRRGRRGARWRAAWLGGPPTALGSCCIEDLPRLAKLTTARGACSRARGCGRHVRARRRRGHPTRGSLAHGTTRGTADGASWHLVWGRPVRLEGCEGRRVHAAPSLMPVMAAR